MLLAPDVAGYIVVGLLLLVDFVGPLKRQMIKKKLQKQKAAETDEAGA